MPFFFSQKYVVKIFGNRCSQHRRETDLPITEISFPLIVVVVVVVLPFLLVLVLVFVLLVLYLNYTGRVALSGMLCRHSNHRVYIFWIFERLS